MDGSEENVGEGRVEERRTQRLKYKWRGGGIRGRRVSELRPTGPSRLPIGVQKKHRNFFRS